MSEFSFGGTNLILLLLILTIWKKKKYTDSVFPMVSHFVDLTPFSTTIVLLAENGQNSLPAHLLATKPGILLQDLAGIT